MTLVIEIGNSNIVLGVFRSGKLASQWRIHTDTSKTSDEYLADLKDLFQQNEIELKSISKTVLASVVTPLIPVFQNVVLRLTEKGCKVIDWKSIPLLAVRVDNPEEVGIDRLVNAYAGYDLYRKPMIIIDLGTATTFDVVNNEGEFLGGVISPGLMLSLNALISNTSKLPKIELDKPESVIGKNTIHCMQSGILFGYAGMVDAMASRIKDELGYEAMVIATGGLAGLVESVSSQIETVIENLTLEGLYKIAQLPGK